MTRYVADTSKALEAVLWIANRRPGIDLYHLCKCMYFADLDHLARHGRPIFGERYDADEYGPLGSIAYGILRRRPLEMMALDVEDVPVRVVSGKPWTVTPEREADPDMLSESDIAAMERSVVAHAGKSFGQLYRETHEHPAYIRANGGMMSYRDMVAQTLGDEDQDLLDAIEDRAVTMAF